MNLTPEAYMGIEPLILLYIREKRGRTNEELYPNFN
jgi:hypothetical protein